MGKAVSALKVLGFHHVVEVALGADMVAHKEAAELVEKGFLTSSCCPAFVDYIEKFFPQMKEDVYKRQGWPPGRRGRSVPPPAPYPHWIESVSRKGIPPRGCWG